MVEETEFPGSRRSVETMAGSQSHPEFLLFQLSLMGKLKMGCSGLLQSKVVLKQGVLVLSLY